VGGSLLPRSRSRRVIQDSEADEADYVDRSDSIAPEKSVPGNIAVVVPASNNDLPSDSNSRSSSEKSSTGYNTPATSVEATGAKLPARINASDRANQLRSSTLSLGLLKRGTKRSTATRDEDDGREASDAALAHKLQMEEYGQPHKRQKPSRAPISQDQVFSDEDWVSEDDESALGDRTVSFSPLSPEPPGFLRGIHAGPSEHDVADPNFAPENPFEEVVDGATEHDLTDPFFASQDSSDEEADLDGDQLVDSEEDLPPTWEEQRKARRVAADRKKLEKKHPTIITMWDDLKSRPVIAPEVAKQPASITRKLKPFQLQGLNWMMQQEQTEYRGGLLGDEMGMGKTIQAVSLIMSDFPQRDPTLVLVPPVALMQWVSEIQVCLAVSVTRRLELIKPIGIHGWQIESPCLP
jgi:DNA repair protein RAD16